MQHRDTDLEYFPISRLVNNPGYDAPDCLQPASPDDQLPEQRRKKSTPQMDLLLE
jgi:hypothetical protein